MTTCGTLITLFVTSLLLAVVSSTGDPILIVPGLTGSQLNVKHTGFTPCNTLFNSVLLWYNEVRALAFGCFIPEMTLSFDRNTGQYSSGDKDITVTVPGFGDTNTVEKLSNIISSEYFMYFKDLVDYFVARGYERGKDVRAAPYDWRLGPGELQRKGYFNELKNLIETMYRQNGNTKVTIVAHSMGAPTVLHFFTSGIVTQSWKNAYIGNFITLSGAWAGGNLVLNSVISGVDFNDYKRGDPFNIFRYVGERIENSLISLYRSFQSMYFLFPHPSVWQNTVLVTTPTQSYTANDYQRLFSDIDFPDGYIKFQGIESINQNWPAPNVSMHCFYGVGVDTPLSFHYRKSFPKGARNDPEVTVGDGDGSVNTPSSEVCLRWAGSGYPFNSKTFNGVDHREIFRNEGVLREIGKIVGAPAEANKPKSWWEDFFG